jgi:molybdate transport system permease protein
MVARGSVFGGFELTSDEWVAVELSLRVAAVATLASLPLGVATALVLARGRFPGKTLLDGLVHLPLVLPPVVTGYVLLVLFGRRGPIGAWLEANLGIVLSFRWTGAALACAVMGFPLMVRAIRLAIEAIDERLEQASGTLGASPLATFFTVTLPLALPGIVAGAVLCFAKALGEFGATITFVSSIPGETRTIPSAIYEYTQTPDGEAGALRLSIVAVVISLGALVISEWLARRGRGRAREAASA